MKDAWYAALYPDVARAGGLLAVIRSRLPTLVFEDPSGCEWNSCGTEVGDRSINAGLGIEERAIVGQVWEAGVCLGSYQTGSLDEVVRVFGLWLLKGASVSRLGEEPIVDLRPDALAHEQGPAAYVEYRWNELAVHPWNPRVGEMARAAMEEPSLRALLPYTSHHVLNFSRSTGYPFSFDCPSIDPLEDGSFEVTHRDGTVIGTGDARQAAALAAAHLPPGCGPAQRGPWPEPSGDADVGDVTQS
jgi:hypothetical protein